MAKQERDDAVAAALEKQKEEHARRLAVLTAKKDEKIAKLKKHVKKVERSHEDHLKSLREVFEERDEAMKMIERSKSDLESRLTAAKAALAAESAKVFAASAESEATAKLKQEAMRNIEALTIENASVKKELLRLKASTFDAMQMQKRCAELEKERDGAVELCQQMMKKLDELGIEF
jgi:hypothetical protein